MSRQGNFGFIAEGCMVGMHMKKVKNMFFETCGEPDELVGWSLRWLCAQYSG